MLADQADAVQDTAKSGAVGLRSTVIGGLRWNAIGTVLVYGVRIGQGIALARLLRPEHYGVVGIAAPALAMLSLLAHMGFGAALIQRQTDTIDRYAHSTFWALLGLTTFLVGICVPLVPAVSDFYQDQRLRGVLSLMLVGLLLNAFAVVPRSLVERALRFREFSVLNAMATLIAAVVAVAMAALGCGYWSLVVPSIAMRCIVALGCMRIARWIPRLRFSWKALKEISSFSLTLFTARILYYAVFNGRNLIVGKYLSPPVFGQFYFALNRSQQPMSMVRSLYHNVAYSAFSRLQGDRRRLLLRYYEAARLTSFSMFPIAILMTSLADLIIPVVFGSQWHQAIFPFQMLSVLAVVSVFGSIPGMLIQVIGKPEIALYSNLVKAPVLLVGLMIVLRSGGGLAQVSAFLPVAEAIVVAPIVLYTWRCLGARSKELWEAHGASFLLSLALGGLVTGIEHVGRGLGVSDAAILAVALAVGGAAYLGLSWLFNRQALLHFSRFALELVEKAQRADAGFRLQDTV